MHGYIKDLAFISLKIYFLLFFYCGVVQAKEKNYEPPIIEFTQGQVAIVASILGPKGNLTTEMHKVFWSEVSENAVKKVGGLKIYESMLEFDLIRRVNLLHSMWQSAKLSWNSGEDIETQEFKDALSEHRELANKSNRLAKLGMRQDIATMMEVILIAASSGAMFRAGEEPILSLEEIKHSLNSHNRGILRAKSLASSRWSNNEE
ncbi:MAG: hypothetical protein CMM30_00550 [Rhodospirillaceae bacterium]|nr:hypothetical protein [Alphaproteobacteria bacterium]MBR71418.1 hypothetical protein [Rhodospirillaceae bacterium]|tara:strand:- start:12723 stop:13337 length:615 start_codon:yes stop_codon:yes gene_type:complete